MTISAGSPLEYTISLQLPHEMPLDTIVHVTCDYGTLVKNIPSHDPGKPPP